MPFAPPKPCAWRGCGALTHERFCAAHLSEDRRRVDRARGSAARRLYGRRWRKLRGLWLLSHPLCAECERQDRVTAAGEVDHVIPHKGDELLFWNQGNWQSLCGDCHRRKTATRDGGFGRGASET